MQVLELVHPETKMEAFSVAAYAQALRDLHTTRALSDIALWMGCHALSRMSFCGYTNATMTISELKTSAVMHKNMLIAGPLVDIRQGEITQAMQNLHFSAGIFSGITLDFAEKHHVDDDRLRSHFSMSWDIDGAGYSDTTPIYFQCTGLYLPDIRQSISDLIAEYKG